MVLIGLCSGEKRGDRPRFSSAATSFSYSGGLYDFLTREFRGFSRVTETRSDSSEMVHFYYQDEAKKGKEYKTLTRNRKGTKI